jgi:hypothetical protein
MLDANTAAKLGFAAWPPVNGGVSVVVADPSNPGGCYIGGNFTQIGTVERNYIARILPNARPDLSWNPNAFTSIGGEGRSNFAVLPRIALVAFSNALAILFTSRRSCSPDPIESALAECKYCAFCCCANQARIARRSKRNIEPTRMLGMVPRAAAS